MTSTVRRHAVVIVGAGAAGITAAALLKRARPELDIAIIDPAVMHYYQPAWTLVGGGSYDIASTCRETRTLIPQGVEHIVERVETFEPEQNRLVLSGGRWVEYRVLIVAAGLQLDWHKIDGLVEALGKNGVSSNYSFKHAPYTWECLKNLRSGTALFTQPAMPIKCAGAPQKALYLAADHFRRNALPVKSHFYTPGAVMFGVPFYAQALDKVVADYGIAAHFSHTLVAVDGPNKKALFEVVVSGEKQQSTQAFDFLHVVPPQSAPDFIKQSPLADASGWMAVDKFTLQSPTFSNVFGFGDCTTTPNSKTAAAVRAQAPVVVANVLKALLGNGIEQKYDGYASCPLTTSRGKVMLAEFCYDGVVTPSFPLDPRIPRRSYWALKKYFLPYLYWEQMLRGRLGPDWHAKREHPTQVPAIQP